MGQNHPGFNDTYPPDSSSLYIEGIDTSQSSVFYGRGTWLDSAYLRRAQGIGGRKGWKGNVLHSVVGDIITDVDTVKAYFKTKSGEDALIMFTEGDYTWDVTPDDTINLVHGTDEVPQFNYIYFDHVADTLARSITGFPATEHARLMTAVVQSVSSVEQHGCYKVQMWTDHLSNGTGHIADINDWIRSQSATWISGVAPTFTINSTPSPDSLGFITTAGVVKQLHNQTVEASDSTDLFVVNDFTTLFDPTDDLANQLTDALGVSMTGKYFSLVIWGSANADSVPSHLYVNLPSGSYNNQSGVEDDFSQYANYVIPSDFKSTGFLISELKLRHQSAGGGTWTLIEHIDLRGLTASTSVGGGAGTGDDWGTDVVNTDATLTGDGTVGGELKVDTSLISTKYYVDQVGGANIYSSDGTFGTTRVGTITDSLEFDLSADEGIFKVNANHLTFDVGRYFDFAAINWDGVRVSTDDNNFPPLIHFQKPSTGSGLQDGGAIGLNAGVSNDNFYLINYENSDFEFWTNNTKRLTIGNDGQLNLDAYKASFKEALGADRVLVVDTTTGDISSVLTTAVGATSGNGLFDISTNPNGTTLELSNVTTTSSGMTFLGGAGHVVLGTQKEGGAYQNMFKMRSAGNAAANYPNLVWEKYRGTFASPSDLSASSLAGAFGMNWYNRSGLRTPMSMEFRTGSTWSGTSDHSHWKVLLTEPGATGRTSVFEIDGSDVYFIKYGSGTKTGTPTYDLQVDASGQVIEAAIGTGDTHLGNTNLTADADRNYDMNGFKLSFNGGHSSFENYLAVGNWTTPTRPFEVHDEGAANSEFVVDVNTTSSYQGEINITDSGWEFYTNSTSKPFSMNIGGVTPFYAVATGTGRVGILESAPSTTFSIGDRGAQASEITFDVNSTAFSYLGSFLLDDNGLTIGTNSSSRDIIFDINGSDRLELIAGDRVLMRGTEANDVIPMVSIINTATTNDNFLLWDGATSVEDFAIGVDNSENRYTISEGTNLSNPFISFDNDDNTSRAIRDFEFEADLLDGLSSPGTAGQVLSSLGVGLGTDWINASGSSEWQLLLGTDLSPNSTSTSVGIGTTTPSAKLHVHETSGDTRLRISTVGAGTADEAYFQFYDGTDNAQLIFEQQTNEAELAFWVQSEEVLTLQEDATNFSASDARVQVDAGYQNKNWIDVTSTLTLDKGHYGIFVTTSAITVNLPAATTALDYRGQEYFIVNKSGGNITVDQGDNSGTCGVSADCIDDSVTVITLADGEKLHITLAQTDAGGNNQWYSH